MIHFNRKHLQKAMANSGILADEKEGRSLGKLKLQLPENLVYVSYISPEAFSHYLPIWVKEQLALRSEQPLKVRRITYEGVSEDYVAGPQIKMYLDVEVVRV